MEKFKSVFKFAFSMVATIVLSMLGANGVLMAAAVDLTGGGKSEGGNEAYKGTTEPIKSDGTPSNQGALNPEGINTETAGRAYAAEMDDAERYEKEVDKKITKIRPMATPIDQISRYASAQKSGSFEVKFYSVGTRPVKTTVSEALTSATGTSAVLKVADPGMFTLDDTIRVVGVKGVTDYKGVAYSGSNVPDLELCVIGKNSDGYPVVYAVNGNVVNGQPVGIPDIAKGTTLIRMGKSCGELDVQTGRFNNIPKNELQYCQNFMMQVEESTFNKIASKQVDYSFSDQEEDSIYDMRLCMENSFLFGDMNKVQHTSKDNAAQWFTKGIWWQAGKDIEVGHLESGKAVISDDDLVDISRDLFVGTGIGNKRKILFCGSDFLTALSKIESEKFRLKDTVEVWDLRFKSWETDFGEILTMHHELLDLNGKSACALSIDPDYLTKYTHLGFTRNALSLKQAGIRNTEAVVLQEVSALVLKYPTAHARMTLVSA